MEINGVAHTLITAGDFAAARAFYGQLLPFLGLTVVADSVNTFRARLMNNFCADFDEEVIRLIHIAALSTRHADWWWLRRWHADRLRIDAQQ